MDGFSWLFSAIRGLPSGRLLGRTTAGSGKAEVLTPASARTLLDVYSTSGTDAAIAGVVSTEEAARIAADDALSTDLALKAPLASPGLTGNPTAPTASAGTNNTLIATTAFVMTAIGDLVASAPTALNTLDELAAALGDDANFAGTITAAIATKAPLASPGFTGTPTAPTAAADTNTTQIATTAFVVAQAGSTNPAMNGSVAAGTSLKYARADHVHPVDTSRAAASHTHASADITDLAEFIRDTIGTALVQGSGVTITVNDGSDTITVSASGGSSVDEVKAVSGMWYSGQDPTTHGTGVSIAANTLYLCPFRFGTAETWDAIFTYLNATGTATVARLGFYEADFSTGPPTFTLLQDAGTVAVNGATGAKSITGLSRATAAGKMVFLAILADGTWTNLGSSSSNLRKALLHGQSGSINGGMVSHYTKAVTYGALPSSVTGVSNGAANLPSVGLRIA